jgi:hypothetical protein
MIKLILNVLPVMIILTLIILTFLASSLITTSIHWLYYCTLHVYVV